MKIASLEIGPGELNEWSLVESWPGWLRPGAQNWPKFNMGTNWCLPASTPASRSKISNVKVVNRAPRDTNLVIPLSRLSRGCSVAGVERRILRQSFPEGSRHNECKSREKARAGVEPGVPKIGWYDYLCSTGGARSPAGVLVSLDAGLASIPRTISFLLEAERLRPGQSCQILRDRTRPRYH
jgi:hypothetical protein